MPRIITKARQLRLDYQARLGRSVTVAEVASAAGIDRAALNRLELGRTTRIDFDTLAKLCRFYGVDVGEVLGYVEESERVNYVLRPEAA